MCGALPERVRAIFPSNIAGGLICQAYLAMKLFKSAEMALTQGIKAVVDAFDSDDRFAPFTPERPQYDSRIPAEAGSDAAGGLRPSNAGYDLRPLRWPVSDPGHERKEAPGACGHQP